LVATWPRRIAAIVATAMLGWVVTHTLPTLWEKTAEKTGLGTDPVQVEVLTDPESFDTFDQMRLPTFVVQRTIEQVGPPPSGEDSTGRFRWAREMEGIDATSTVLRLIIRGSAADPVILNNLEVEELATGPPLAGTLLSYFGQGAGQAVRSFKVDLDADPARAKFLDQGGQAAVPFPYRVSSSEVEVFDVYASTLKSHVKWRLRLHYSAAGKDGTLAIGDRGRPFETTAETAADFYGWLEGRWQGLPR
jgi:hypothetical protein